MIRKTNEEIKQEVIEIRKVIKVLQQKAARNQRALINRATKKHDYSHQEEKMILV